MLAADEKQTALQTIQAVVTAIAQNHYAAIPTLLSRSDLPMEELQGEIERVLRFQKTTVAPFSEAFADFYEDEFKIVAREDGSWLVDGHYSLHDFLTYFDMDELIGDYEVTTVSGLIITELGVIPKQGQKLIWNKLEFEVIDMDGVKIDKVLITNLKE